MLMVFLRLFVLFMQPFLITRGCLFMFLVLFRLFVLAAALIRVTVVTGAVTAWRASDKLIYTHSYITSQSFAFFFCALFLPFIVTCHLKKLFLHSAYTSKLNLNTRILF